MIVFNFFDSKRTPSISYVSSLPFDTANGKAYYYCFNVEDNRVEFRGNQVNLYFCVESKSWIPFVTDTSDGRKYMAFESILIKV